MASIWSPPALSGKPGDTEADAGLLNRSLTSLARWLKFQSPLRVIIAPTVVPYAAALTWTLSDAPVLRVGALTGNITITISLLNLDPGALSSLTLLQDGTGGRTLTFAGATLLGPGGVIPAIGATANKKTVYTFYYDGVSLMVSQFGANY